MICRHCGTEISTASDPLREIYRCPTCGALYRRKSAGTEKQGRNPAGARCARCGSLLEDGARFCHECGSPCRILGAQCAPPPRQQEQKKKRSRITLALIGLLLLAAAGALAAAFFLCRVSFDPGFDTLGSVPAVQIVVKGRLAREPQDPRRDGLLFLGWYSEKHSAHPYNFRQPVRASLTLTAKWLDPTDTKDTDGDGLNDATEASIGTDIGRADTDGDGLSDYIEFKVIGLDPLAVDTDESGTPDGQKDSDADGLVNLSEIEYGTSPILSDSDFDGLSDYEEIAVYGTSPLDADTDRDGANDETELRIGSDPLRVEESFMTRACVDAVSRINPVGITVSAETDSAGAGSLSVCPVTSTNIPALSSASHGYLGVAYEISADGILDRATISFRYDPALGTVGDGFMPCIYYYDEKENELVELSDQTVENGAVTAEIDHFSTYILLNKALVETEGAGMRPSGGAALTDSNGDGLADYYAELINDGTIQYDNTDMLVGVLDMFGRDSDDWDGDGLKNGEEIFIVPNSRGYARIWIRSNPILRDSDFDNISDYIETRQLHTNPLRYDHKSCGALNQLTNDSHYLYASYEKDWRDYLAEFFDGKKYEEAKACLIDYFYDYAPEETIRKNAEAIAERENHELALKAFNAVSTMLKATRDCIKYGYENAELEQLSYESIDLKKNMLSDLQRKQVHLDFLTEQLSLFGLPDELKTIVEELSSGSKEQLLDASVKIISTASNALKVYQNACQIQVYSLAKEFGDCTKGAAELGCGEVVSHTTGFLSVVCNIADAAGNVQEVSNTYGKLRANADAYNMYTQLLLHIRDNAGEDHVRNAAKDIAAIVMENGCTEYYRQLAEACDRELKASAFKIALNAAAKHNAYAWIAEKFVELYNMIGISDQAKYNVYFEVMTEISKGCNALLDRVIKKETQTFSYPAEDGAWVEKYLVQLAQSRIIGEYYFHEYCASKNGAGLLAAILSGTDPEEFREMFKTETKEIYGYANRLKLRLSKNLPYYNEFWKSDVPEDELEDVEEYVNIELATREAAKLYLEILENRRDAINSYTWERGYHGQGYQREDMLARPVAVCDVYGNEIPELLFLYCDTPYTIRLCIVTFDVDHIRILYHDDWGGLVAGGHSYYFFQMKNSKQLYSFTLTSDDIKSYCYASFEEAANKTLAINPVLNHSILHGSTQENYQDLYDSYEFFGEEISQKRYQTVESAIQTGIGNLLMFSTGCGGFPEQYAAQYGCSAMTCDEAIAYLSGILGVQPEIPETYVLDAGYLGTRYEQVKGYDDPAYANTFEVTSIWRNGDLFFNMGFYRLGQYDRLCAHMTDDSTARFFDEEQNLSGTLEFSGGSVLLTVDDRPGFYLDRSAAQYLQPRHLFSPLLTADAKE